MNIADLLKGYDSQNLTIGALGGHSALDVCAGAKKQGFKTVVVAKEGRNKTYDTYFKTREGRGCIDEVIPVKNFEDVLEENKKNQSFHYRYKTLKSKYQHLLSKAVLIGNSGNRVLFFKYSGDLSISRDLANELSYRFSDKIIVVIYTRGLKANISMRGENVKGLLSKAIDGFENARGGGHKNAVGGQIQVKDIEEFREKLEKLVTDK